MSFVAAHLREFWFIHSADLSAFDDTLTDDDNHPVIAYADLITVTHCRLMDMTAQQLIEAEAQGLQLVTNILLVPTSVVVRVNDKVSHIRVRTSGVQVDDREFSVEAITTQRSAAGDEYRQLTLRRIS